MDYKEVISLICVIFSVFGYGLYIKDIIIKKTRPHLFTYLIWSIASLVTWALQVYGGAGVGASITLATGIMCVIIFLLSFKYGDKDITFLDIIFLITSIVAIILWVFVRQPVLSIILLVSADVFGFAPTIRKSWNKPFEETLFVWELVTIRGVLSITALERFNVLTLLYPIVWVIVNFIFCVMLIYRRKVLKK